MNNNTRLFFSGALLSVMIGITSCSQDKKSEQAEAEGQEHLEMKEKGHHQKEETHSHGETSGNGHGTHAEMKMGQNKTWTPSGNGIDLIKSDFHFITGNLENINPVVKEVDGEQVLELDSDGTPAAFVFHNQYGNVGMIVKLKKLDFTGTISLIHHAKDLTSYDFIAIKGQNMKLGRVVNGQEDVFDEGDFDSGNDWMSLKVTAAGTHFKGYVDEKTVTHGHGDKMANGFVGIMVDGKGKIQIGRAHV